MRTTNLLITSSLRVSLWLALLASIFISSLGQAATITVNSILDDNGSGCTLREAILSANNPTNQGNGCATGGPSGTDTITFSSDIIQPNNIISLSNTLFVESKNIDFDASASRDGIVLESTPIAVIEDEVYFGFSVFKFDGSNVRLHNFTITESEPYRNADIGGGIYIDGGSMHLENCLITESDNSGITISGGANVTLFSSSIVGNRSAYGGGGVSMGIRDYNLLDAPSTGNRLTLTNHHDFQ